MKLSRMLGYKLFKINENNEAEIIRIIKIDNKNNKLRNFEKVDIYNYSTDRIETGIKVEKLKDYTPLEPDAFFTISIATVVDTKGVELEDVVCTISNYRMVKSGMSTIPYGVCRQNITDVFNNLLVTSDNDDDMLVGLAVNMNTCPANFEYKNMFVAKSVRDDTFINFYVNDTIDDILKMVDVDIYNKVLSDLFNRHINHIQRPDLLFLSEHGGWCKDVETLLKINNFQSDINEMLDIMQVDFNIMDYSIDKTLSKDGEEIKYKSMNEALNSWFSCMAKINITDSTILDYNHDIDLSNIANYYLIRDNTSTLYVIFYTKDNEKYKYDFEEESKKYDFSTNFKIYFYDKYNRNKM